MLKDGKRRLRLGACLDEAAIALGVVYHALNRAVARLPLFRKDRDFEAFERILGEALMEHPTRLFPTV